MAGLDLSVAQWLLLCAAGALAGADDTSWPQAMVSRPAVAGTAAGAVVGDAAAGLLAGAALELMVLPYPRMGATRTPDPGVAGVVGGAAYAASGGGTAALAVAVLAGWGAGWTGELGVRSLRRLHGRLVGRPGELSGDPRRLERRHRWSMRLEFVRGAVITAALVVPGAVLASVAGGLGAPAGAGTAAAAAAAAGIGAASGSSCRVLSSGRRRPALLLTGLVAGVGLAALAAA